MKVDLCLSGSGRPAGSYTGTLRIAGAGIRPVEIPITADLKDIDLPLVFGGLVLASLIALVYKWGLENLAAGGGSGFPRWLREHWIVAAIAVLGGAGTVYYKQYVSNPAFVAANRFSLWLAAAAAVLTASVLTTAGHKAITRSDKPEAGAKTT